MQVSIFLAKILKNLADGFRSIFHVLNTVSTVKARKYLDSAWRLFMLRTRILTEPAVCQSINAGCTIGVDSSVEVVEVGTRYWQADKIIAASELHKKVDFNEVGELGEAFAEILNWSSKNAFLKTEIFMVGVLATHFLHELCTEADLWNVMGCPIHCRKANWSALGNSLNQDRTQKLWTFSQSDDALSAVHATIEGGLGLLEFL